MAAQPTSTFADEYRPPVEAIDDLDWYCQESASEMGAESCQGGLLDRAAFEYEWCEPDRHDEDSKTSLRNTKNKPIGHYGASYGDQPWLEFVVDATPGGPGARGGKKPSNDGGYYREVWGARGVQDTSAQAGSVSGWEITGAEMRGNIDEVLALMPARLRQVVLTQHEPRAHERTMREVFGTKAVQIVALASSARTAFEYARAARERLISACEQLETHPRPFGREDADRHDRMVSELARPLGNTVYDFLEGLALRSKESKSKKGEKDIMKAAAKEMAGELAVAYVVFEEARARLPWRRYPSSDPDRHAKRLTLERS